MTDALTQPKLGSVDLEGQVLAIVRDVLGRPSMGPTDDMFDHGATSLSFVRVLAQLHQSFHVMVHAPSLNGVTTARSLAAQVAAGSADIQGA
jgi:hypothetical protein